MMKNIKEKRVVYVSRLIDQTSFAKLFTNQLTRPGQQGPKFHRLLIQGLLRNGYNVSAVSGPPVTSHNCSKKLVCLKQQIIDGISYRYAPTINIPIIRNISQFVYAFMVVLSQCICGETIVLCDVLQGSISYAAMIACRLTQKKCIGIVTDLPGLLVTGASKRYISMVNRIIDGCTHYVLLTEYMNSVVNKSNKPYVVIEGISNSQVVYDKMISNTKKQVCMYAGMIEEKYGVKMMVEAFIAAQIPTAELHIYGNGTYSAALKEVASENPCIFYHGSALVEEVEEAERRADLLINPRPSTEEFTKYSFPSKNMEYMTSGTPALITRLPGIPDEYYKYVYTFEEETIKGMANTMKSVLSIPKVQRTELGKKAQRFVCDQKNEYVQAKKIADGLF